MARRPTQRQLFAELTAKFGPEVAEAFMVVVADLKSGVEFQRLVAAIDQGDLNGAMEALHLDRAAFHALEAKINEAFIAGGQAAVSSMPPSVAIGFRFDPGNQRAAAIIRATAGRLITGLLETEREQARQFIAEGMARGAHPRAVGLDLVGRISRVTGTREGGLMGLSAPQRAYVATARAELASADPKLLKHYLTRGRRDRRFDRSITKAIREGRAVDPEIAARAITAYERRLLQLRGEIIARTEGIPAIRAAKKEAYQQLVDSGRITEAEIERAWHNAGDRRVRDTHDAMGGQKVRGLTLPFQSPSGALMMYPGDASLGAGADEVVACRCDESISIKRAA